MTSPLPRLPRATCWIWYHNRRYRTPLFTINLPTTWKCIIIRMGAHQKSQPYFFCPFHFRHSSCCCVVIATTDSEITYISFISTSNCVTMLVWNATTVDTPLYVYERMRKCELVMAYVHIGKALIYLWNICFEWVGNHYSSAFGLRQAFNWGSVFRNHCSLPDLRSPCQCPMCMYCVSIWGRGTY